MWAGKLLKKASARKLPVRCFDLTPPDLTGLDASAVEVVTGDITSPEAVQAAMKDVATVMFVIGRKRGTKTQTHDMVEHGGMKNVIASMPGGRC